MKQTPFKGFNEFAVFECLMTEKPVWKVWAQIAVKTGYRLDYLPIRLQHTALSMLKSTGRRRQRARLKLLEGMERLIRNQRYFRFDWWGREVRPCLMERVSITQNEWGNEWSVNEQNK